MILLNKIQQLLPKLPERDRYLADHFISVRNFDELALLVKSIIVLIDKNNGKNNTSLYSNLDRDSIALLLDYINDYLNQLTVEEDII